MQKIFEIPSDIQGFLTALLKAEAILYHLVCLLLSLGSTRVRADLAPVQFASKPLHAVRLRVQSLCISLGSVAALLSTREQSGSVILLSSVGVTDSLRYGGLV